MRLSILLREVFRDDVQRRGLRNPLIFGVTELLAFLSLCMHGWIS